jgi:flagellar protein FlbT
LRGDKQRSAHRSLIEGAAPILREKDIMTASAANSPAKRIYLAVQLIVHLARRRLAASTSSTSRLMRDIIQAAPSTWQIVATIQ